MKGRKTSLRWLKHEAFRPDAELEQAGMLEELAHVDEAAKRTDDPIIGRRGRAEEDNTSLMVSGGVV